MHVEKPLLGFGPMGWALLVLAGALVVVWVTGYDLQYHLFAAIQATLGNRAMEFFAYRFISLHTFNATMPQAQVGFGLWGLCAVCIAFWVYPRPLRWWRWSLVIAWGLVAPIAWWDINKNVLSVMKSLGTPDIMLAILISDTLKTLLLCAMLILTTRSKFVLIAIAFFGACTLTYPVALYHYGIFSTPLWLNRAHSYFAWAWNPLLLAILLSWAIPARIRYNRWWRCYECGYNMRNLETNTCPECGGVNERMPAALPTTPASS